MQEIINGLKKISEELENFPAFTEPVGLYHPIKLILEEDKRYLVGISVIISSEMFEGATSDTHFAACGLELFYLFCRIRENAIIHPSRDSDTDSKLKFFTANTAILSGDALHILVFDMLLKCSDKYLVKLLQLFVEMFYKIFEGYLILQGKTCVQTLPVNENRGSGKMRMAEIIGSGMKAGALLGNAGNNCQEKFYEIGRCVGTIIQIDADCKLLMNLSAEENNGVQQINESQTGLFLYYINEFEKSGPPAISYQRLGKDIVLNQLQMKTFLQKLTEFKNCQLDHLADLQSRCEFSDEQIRKFKRLISAFPGLGIF